MVSKRIVEVSMINKGGTAEFSVPYGMEDLAFFHGFKLANGLACGYRLSVGGPYKIFVLVDPVLTNIFDFLGSDNTKISYIPHLVEKLI